MIYKGEYLEEGGIRFTHNPRSQTEGYYTEDLKGFYKRMQESFPMTGNELREICEEFNLEYDIVQRTLKKRNLDYEDLSLTIINR